MKNPRTKRPSSSTKSLFVAEPRDKDSRLGARVWERLEVRNLRQLMYPQEGPCVTLYLNSERWMESLPEGFERAGGLLRKFGDETLVENILKPFKGLPLRLAKEPELMSAKGVAIFRSAGLAGYFPMNELPEEQMVVADSFHLRPVLNLIQDSHKYFVMTLEQERIVLYLGTQQTLDVFTDYEPGPEHRRGKKGPVVLEAFFHSINERLRKSGELGRCPLILMGEQELIDEYRKVNSYSAVIEEPVRKMDLRNVGAIRDILMPRLVKWYADKELSAINDFRRLSDTSRAVDDLQEIARASAKGRIKTLILAKGVHLWGVEGRPERPTELSITAIQDDVMDDLAERVVSRGGQVISLEPQKMPTHTPVAAVYHW